MPMTWFMKRGGLPNGVLVSPTEALRVLSGPLSLKAWTGKYKPFVGCPFGEI